MNVALPFMDHPFAYWIHHCIIHGNQFCGDIHIHEKRLVLTSNIHLKDFENTLYNHSTLVFINCTSSQVELELGYGRKE